MKVAVGAEKARSYDGDYMEAGKFAENRVLQWLERNPSVIGIDDLRDLRPMREADVDASIKLFDGRVALAEIKSDRWLKGRCGSNVLFEILRINHTAPPDKCCTLGWAARSPAQWLLYYSPEQDAIYCCRFADLRRVFQKYTESCRQSSGMVQYDWTNTDNIKSTLNVLIPWGYCEKVFTIHHVTTEKKGVE